MNPFPILIRIAAGLVLATLAACGGGGGGGGGGGTSLPPPPVYAGITNAAVVTAVNASKLTADVAGSSDTVGIIGGVSTDGGAAAPHRGSGAMHLAQRLYPFVRDAATRAGRASSAQRIMSAVIPIEQTDPCDSGSVRTSGTLNDNGTGTLAITFNNCLLDGITVNGPATLRVDDAMVTFSVLPIDSTLLFSVLTIRGPGLSVDASGSLQLVLSTAPFGTETFTANLVSRDNNTGETGKTENLVIVTVSTSQTSYTLNVSGRVFDPVHGFVDVTTPTLLVFSSLSQLFPDSGVLLLTGAGNSTIRITAVNSTLVQLQLDTNGDTIVDITARLKWIELTGPVGADLADGDGDGMHNSWETFYGLDPVVDDAAGDKDGDLDTNINEYMAGTTP